MVKSKNMPAPVLEATEATNAAIKDSARLKNETLVHDFSVAGLLGGRMFCGSSDGVGQEAGER